MRPPTDIERFAFLEALKLQGVDGAVARKLYGTLGDTTPQPDWNAKNLAHWTNRPPGPLKPVFRSRARWAA